MLYLLCLFVLRIRGFQFFPWLVPIGPTFFVLSPLLIPLIVQVQLDIVVLVFVVVMKYVRRAGHFEIKFNAGNSDSHRVWQHDFGSSRLPQANCMPKKVSCWHSLVWNTCACMQTSSWTSMPRFLAPVWIALFAMRERQTMLIKREPNYHQDSEDVLLSAWHHSTVVGQTVVPINGNDLFWWNHFQWVFDASCDGLCLLSLDCDQV